MLRYNFSNLKVKELDMKTRQKVVKRNKEFLLEGRALYSDKLFSKCKTLGINEHEAKNALDKFVHLLKEVISEEDAKMYLSSLDNSYQISKF